MNISLVLLFSLKIFFFHSELFFHFVLVQFKDGMDYNLLIEF
jgi:hypothetical protein